MVRFLITIAALAMCLTGICQRPLLVQVIYQESFTTTNADMVNGMPNLTDEKKASIIAAMGATPEPINAFEMNVSGDLSVYAHQPMPDTAADSKTSTVSVIIKNVESIYYHNFLSDSLKAHIVKGQGDYFVADRAPRFDWEVTGETREILGITCLRAVGTDCDASIVAWFAPELPVPGGPRWYGGLPGLILRVEMPATNEVIEAKTVRSGANATTPTGPILTSSFSAPAPVFYPERYVGIDVYCAR